MTNSQKRAWISWKTMLNQIINQIKSSKLEDNIVSHDFWEYILDKLKYYYLNKNDTLYFFNLLKQYLKINAS